MVDWIKVCEVLSFTSLQSFACFSHLVYFTLYTSMISPDPSVLLIAFLRVMGSAGSWKAQVVY